MLERGWRWKSRGRSRAVAGTGRLRFVGGWRWTRPLLSGISPASGPGGFYIIVVVVALLFCHGAFGYAHQLPPVEAPSAHAAHAMGGHQPAPDQAPDGLHLGDTYFATLLLLLFGALLLLGGGVWRIAKPPTLAPWVAGHRVRGLPSPRGPTLPSLQVFRH